MFQQGESYKTVKKAIQNEARERFGERERVAVPPDLAPRLDVT